MNRDIKDLIKQKKEYIFGKLLDLTKNNEMAWKKASLTYGRCYVAQNGDIAVKIYKSGQDCIHLIIKLLNGMPEECVVLSSGGKALELYDLVDGEHKRVRLKEDAKRLDDIYKKFIEKL